MIAIEDVTAVLLCAGASVRFGPGNKLLAPWRGMPLAAHAADRLRAVRFREHVSVLPDDAEPQLRDLLARRGFSSIPNPEPARGKDWSIRLAFEHAVASNARAVLIALGDMPNITTDHLHALAAAAGPERIAISAGDGWDSPPVLFPASFFARYLAGPPQPLRSALGDFAVTRIPADPELLLDFDTREDFDRS